MTLSATELYRRGRAHLNAGQNAAARRVLALAAERTDDPDLRARITGSLAAVVIRQGDPATAERLCRDALRSPHLRPQTSAMLHGQLGLLALERGDLAEAVAWLDRGIEGIGDDREHRTPMLINRSVAHMQAGDLAAARADLERAAADYAASGDEVERAMAVHNAGYVALLEGDLVTALEFMSQARAVMERASAVNTAICDLDRAEVLRDAGLTTEAERALERVARVFGAHRMRSCTWRARSSRTTRRGPHAPRRRQRGASARSTRTRGPPRPTGCGCGRSSPTACSISTGCRSRTPGASRTRRRSMRSRRPCARGGCGRRRPLSSSRPSCTPPTAGSAGGPCGFPPALRSTSG
jgi:tetratricopeptide (TPR) repeat protein